MNKEKKLHVFMNNTYLGKYEFLDCCKIAKGAKDCKLSFFGTCCFIN